MGLFNGNKRFQMVYSQSMGDTEIWVDTVTGVNYLWHHEATAGGLTPLLDRDGKPVISPLPLNTN